MNLKNGVFFKVILAKKRTFLVRFLSVFGSVPEISVKLEEGGGLGFFQNFTQSVKFLPFFFGGFPYLNLRNHSHTANQEML